MPAEQHSGTNVRELTNTAMMRNIAPDIEQATVAYLSLRTHTNVLHDDYSMADPGTIANGCRRVNRPDDSEARLKVLEESSTEEGVSYSKHGSVKPINALCTDNRDVADGAPSVGTLFEECGHSSAEHTDEIGHFDS